MIFSDFGMPALMQAGGFLSLNPTLKTFLDQSGIAITGPAELLVIPKDAPAAVNPGPATAAPVPPPTTTTSSMPGSSPADYGPPVPDYVPPPHLQKIIDAGYQLPWYQSPVVAVVGVGIILVYALTHRKPAGQLQGYRRRRRR